MRLIISLLLNILLALPLFAQEAKQDRVKKIEALRAAYITKKMDLSPEEAQKFWPVYNEYQGEISGLYRQKRQNQLSKKNDSKEALTQDLDYDTKILNVRKEYQKEFSKILPSDKVMALYQAEREFREELIKELRERRRNKD
jgi:5'-deoxynucleotidase YfbR-like HD superfamily hydrolase